MFPSVLKEALEKTTNMANNIRSGFSATGICPFNPQQVLKRLPRLEENDQMEIGTRMLSPVLQLLKSNRFGDSDGARRGRKKKVNTPAGRAVSLNDFEGNERIAEENVDSPEENVDSPDEMEGSSSSSDDEDSESGDSSSDESSQEDNNDAEVETNEENDLSVGSSSGPNIEPANIDPKIHEFYSVQFKTKEDSRLKMYIGQILGFEGSKVKLKFLRHRDGRTGDYFVFPDIDDISSVNLSSVMHKFTILVERRGIYKFKEDVNGIF